jgi:hypothetical protein
MSIFISDYTTLLITLLFENLIQRLTDAHPLDHTIANSIVVRLAQLANEISLTVYGKQKLRAINNAYHFCALPNVSGEAIVSALRLVRITDLGAIKNIGFPPGSLGEGGASWLYKTLELIASGNLSISASWISDLWQTLLALGPARDTVSVESLRVLLSALSMDESDPIFGDRKMAERLKYSAYCACEVIDSADHWRADPELGKALHKRSIWVNLGKTWHSTTYINLGHKLSREPEWKQIISNDLPGWLDHRPENQLMLEKFQSVLSLVWDADAAEAAEFGEEATLVMMCGVLTNAWNQAQFSGLGAYEGRHYIKLLYSTVEATFSARIRYFGCPKDIIPSRRFQETIFVRLGEALGRGGGNAKQALENDSGTETHLKNSIQRLADLISGFALTILGELRSPQPPDTMDWTDLKQTWLFDLGSLRAMFEKAVASARLIVEE